MKVLRTLPLSPLPPHPVLTIGNFDGQHVGHLALVKAVVDQARRHHGTPMVLTFDPHPAKVLSPGIVFQSLSNQLEKQGFFERHGVENLIILEFTRELSNFSPEQFVFKILKDGLGVKDILVGENFVFGKGRSGNIRDLMQMGTKANFQVHPFAPVHVDKAVVSSTRIRQYIQKGQMEEAERCLGRYYSLTGPVIPGEGRGTELGWPTANLRIPKERVIPPDGVYVTTTLVKGNVQESVSYIGSRPTFNEGERMLEVHLLGRNCSLYGKEITVSFIERLRGDEKFSTVPDLLRQMELDANQARERLRVSTENSTKKSAEVCS